MLAVDPGMLWRWETGQRKLHKGFLARIEAFLGSIC
jgi:hypothetical protein